jgi:hypothetical protein
MRYFARGARPPTLTMRYELKDDRRDSEVPAVLGEAPRCRSRELALDCSWLTSPSR